MKGASSSEYQCIALRFSDEEEWIATEVETEQLEKKSSSLAVVAQHEHVLVFTKVLLFQMIALYF